MREVFEFHSYVAYLVYVFSVPRPRLRRADLCRHLRCQPSFLSQVLTGKSHFTLEHAISTGEFLGHRRDERRFFLLLVQKDRAASKILRAHFEEEREAELSKRQPLKSVLGVEGEILPEDEALYYSQWWFSAIHILVAFPEFRTIEAISARLCLDFRTVKSALLFLTEKGFVVANREKYGIGKTRIHLGSQSPFLARHHMNWRSKCVDMLERSNEDDLHFSGVIGVSREGARRIKSALISLLRTSEDVIQNSKEEAPFVLLADFFEL
jgi:uncharacterized protein (TIGR02147 family)